MYCSFKSYLYDIGDAKRAKRYIAKILQTFFQYWALLGRVGWFALRSYVYWSRFFIYFIYLRFCLELKKIFFYQTHLFKSKQQCTKWTFSLIICVGLLVNFLFTVIVFFFFLLSPTPDYELCIYLIFLICLSYFIFISWEGAY